MKLIVAAMICLVGVKTVITMPVAEVQDPLQVVPLGKAPISTKAVDPEASLVPLLSKEPAEPAPVEPKPAEPAEKLKASSEPMAENLQLSEKAEEKKEEPQQPKAEEKKEEIKPEKAA